MIPTPWQSKKILEEYKQLWAILLRKCLHSVHKGELAQWQGRTIILCKVNRHRRYSSNLPQGELEVPSVLIFVAAEEKEKVETMRIIESVLGIKPKESAECTTHTPIPGISGALTIQIQPVEFNPFIDFTEQAQDTDQSPWNEKQKLFS